MNTPAHLSIGLAVSLGVCAATGTGPEFAAGVGFASLVGSRAPDWDIKLERWRRRLAAKWFIGRPFRGFAVRHRGGSHWLVSALLFTAVCTAGAFLAWSAATLAVFVGTSSGYFGHLAGDGCTIRGVPFWGPWDKRCRHLLGPRARIRMSHGGGDILGMLASLAALGFAVLLIAPVYDRMLA